MAEQEPANALEQRRTRDPVERASTAVESLKRIAGLKGKRKTDPGIIQANYSLKPRSFISTLVGFLMFVVLPTTAVAYYWWGVAADRYVTEFRYSVRGGAMNPEGGSGGGVLGGGAGALVYAADSFILEDYLSSVTAFRDAAEHVPVREMLGKDGDDPVRGYDPDAPIEDLIGYWRRAVTANFDAITGITTVTVSLFTPEDSRMLGEQLVTELDRVVDELSRDARERMLRYVNGEVERAAAELDEARQELEAFRRENNIISPVEEATIGTTIIGALSEELAKRRVELRSLLSRSPANPRIDSLREQIAAIEAQLREENRQRGSDDERALPRTLTNFDELQSTYEIAREQFVNTLRLKQEAEAAATLSQSQLVVFVPPRQAAQATEPERILMTAKIAAIILVAWIVARIFLASLRP